MVVGKKGEKALSFGARLKYPIKITKLYKNPGDAIKRQEPVLQYSFEYTMELPQDRQTLELKTKTLTSITEWNSPEDGKLLRWHVHVGDVLSRDSACLTVEETCTHEVQFQGLCGICGKDMNEFNWASEHRDTERAPINMTHDQTKLTVSRVAATRAENELQERLLSQRKLSLVVDLDQTIIHACIDPTIGEWLQDPANPNYDALKDVQRFQLDEGFHGLARGCWYYIKLRPGLANFLANIGNMYELHVYTMGTRTYATNIARIVDPEQKLFGNRVISRDENGNIVAKSLQRLFPVSTNMAVIMDDRADVWPYNRRNLIKVTPYDFFKGTGDINSSFLPKRNDLPASATLATPDSVSSSDASSPASSSVPAPPPADAAGNAVAATAPGASSAQDASTDASTETATAVAITDCNTAVASPASSAATAAVLSPAKSGSNGDIPAAVLEDTAIASAILQKQAEEQERTIEQQIKERPLLHMQEKLDKEDEEAAAAAVPEGTAETETQPDSSPMRPSRHCVLIDDDNELAYLEQHLTELHSEFYREYDSKRNSTFLLQDDVNATAVPDVGKVLDKLKAKVLHGTTIVLSGLVPLGTEVEWSEIGLQTISFGARLQKQISRKVTHLVISSDRPRTQKVRQAALIPSIKIVNQHWLADCFSQWTRVDETPYLIDVHPVDRERVATSRVQGEITDTDTLTDQDSDQENDSAYGNEGSKPKLIIKSQTQSNALSHGDAGDDADTDGGDGGEDGNDYGDNEFKDFQDSDSRSPIAELGKFDWLSADDELESFLAEGDDDEEDDEANEDGEVDYGENDDDEDGAENDDDTQNGGPSSVAKRKLGDETDTDNELAPPSRGRNLFAKRQKLRVPRSRSASKLRSWTTFSSDAVEEPTSNDGSGQHPLSQSQTVNSGDAPGSAETSKPAARPASIDIDEDQLEAMLMAELDEEEAAADNG